MESLLVHLFHRVCAADFISLHGVIQWVIGCGGSEFSYPVLESC